MLRTLDRYLVREIALPFAIALVVFTFVLMIPPILREAEAFIARGVELSVVARALVLLMPQALSVTIPMAVLLGVLVGLGRLSADREFVALQACGVSLARLLRPVLFIAALGTAATAYEIIVALPESNQQFREITMRVMAERLESTLKPRVFFEEFPHRAIYVRDVPAGGGWRDVFVGDLSRAGYATVLFAREGRITVDREQQLVQLELTDGTSYTTSQLHPETYESTEFESHIISLDPQNVFRPPPPKGAPEKTLAELRQTIADEQSRGQPAYDARFMVQYKFSLPATCVVLALIGLALGASSHKGGRLASFVLGFGVILLFYVLLYGARAFAMGQRLNPDWAPWIPNILMGGVAALLLAWRARAADRPIRFSVPVFWRRREPAPAAKAPRVVVVVRVPTLRLPLPRVLDVYVAREWARVFALGVVSLLGIFYISTFIDLVDKLFRGQATSSMLARYFFFETPQFVFYVIPMAVLVATLVTIGVMTKNSELLVMRACGISLYRTAAPLVVFGIAAGALLYGLQERVLAYTNREADRLEAAIRGYSPPPSALSRQWRLASNGDIYHFDFFDADANRFSRLSVYDVDERAWRLRGMTDVAEAAFVRQEASEGGAAFVWQGRQGWSREIAPPHRDGAAPDLRYAAITERVLPLEPPAYFVSEAPVADQMTYAQLRDYIARLQASGAYVVRYQVALQRKIAFPCVTIIMTLLAVPFAVTTGRRGALHGIGVGIVIAIVYFVAMSLFGALGAGGVLSPMLAAWAPNILFGAAALFMILTVRT
jgi:LPS export ABC transporter permease LptF/LPS export ABC transporter permease LptG